jgi:hypothetical protein
VRESPGEESDGYLGEEAEGILRRIERWADDLMAKGLPLHVEEVKIYPEEMPLDTLQFTERLVYQKVNAIKMLTMGCYNTLWQIRGTLESQLKDDLDERDQLVLRLLKKWMDIREWPSKQKELESLREEWKCHRTTCVFNAQSCPHGMRTAGTKSIGTG